MAAQRRLPTGAQDTILPHRAEKPQPRIVFPKPGGRKKIAQGASPGSACQIGEPRNGAKDALVVSSSAPFRGSPGFHVFPRAHALGYYLTPLRGWGCGSIIARCEGLERV